MYLKYRINLWNKEELSALTKPWILFTIPLYHLNEAIFLQFRDLTTLTQIAWRRRRTSTGFPAKWETRHLVEREENGERKRRRDTSIRRERRDPIVVVHCTRIAFVIAPRGLSLSAFRFLSRLRATFGLVCESENDSDEVEWRSGLLVRLKRARLDIIRDSFSCYVSSNRPQPLSNLFHRSLLCFSSVRSIVPLFGSILIANYILQACCARSCGKFDTSVFVDKTNEENGPPPFVRGNICIARISSLLSWHVFRDKRVCWKAVYRSVNLFVARVPC